MHYICVDTTSDRGILEGEFDVGRKGLKDKCVKGGWNSKSIIGLCRKNLRYSKYKEHN